MHHRSKKNPVPRSTASTPPPRRPRVRLVAIGEAEVCPACERRACPDHRKGRAATLEEARALLAGADGTLRRDGKGRWWAYSAS